MTIAVIERPGDLSLDEAQTQTLADKIDNGEKDVETDYLVTRLLGATHDQAMTYATGRLARRR